METSYKPMSLDFLPDDIFFQICFWLSVVEILALSAVNKRIRYLTKESSVWQLLLRRLDLALPSCQVVLPSSYVDGTLHTVEYYVCRALRLEQNWSSNLNPPAKHYRFNVHTRVLAMRMLPGGNHMVTVSQVVETGREHIVIWDMSFRGRRNHVAIVTLHTKTTVHELQARYALVKGHTSLVIAFARPRMDSVTNVAALSIPLGVLNEISKLGVDTQAGHEFLEKTQWPFEKLCETKTQYSVGAMSLSDIVGHPLLAVVHRPRKIAFYDLTSRESENRTALKLGPIPLYETWHHSIWDIKILPIQRQVLVIRVIIQDFMPHMHGDSPTIPIVFELYDIPPKGAVIEHPTARERRIIPNYLVEEFYVSDGDASWNFNIDPEHHNPMLHKLANCPPPPISIFVSTRVPRGFVHFLMRPEIMDGNNGAYSYSLPNGTHSKYEWDDHEAAEIIPGAYRSIVYMRSTHRKPTQGVSVLKLTIYSTDGYKFSTPSDSGHITTFDSDDVVSDETMDVVEDGPMSIRSPTQRALKYPVVPLEVAQAMRNGIRSIQFDEWLGRLLVSTVNPNYDEEDQIDVLDWSL